MESGGGIPGPPRERFCLESSAAAAALQKISPAKKELVATFADTVMAFTTCTPEQVLEKAPELLVGDLGAARAEMWLWDPSSSSCYLTFAAGKDVQRRQDFLAAGSGAIGKVAQTGKTIENLGLAGFHGEDQAVAESSGLTHITCYPLNGSTALLGVLAVYTAGEASPDLVNYWQIYSDMVRYRAQEALEALQSRKKITQLSLLFEATRLLNSTLDLAELLELILKIARTEVKADRGSVFLVDSKKQELWSIVASGLGDHQEIRVPFGKGVAGRVAASGAPVNVEDAYALDFFDSSHDVKFGYKTKSLLCLPIRHHTGEVVGVIQLLNEMTRGRFNAEDEEFLSNLTGHMAMALENARLHREALEKQRLEKEMELARQIQRSLLPDRPPVVPGYEIAVLNEPCFEVGGDYYDFLSLGPQSLLLVIADVEGKGVSSALVMSNLQATLRALVMHLHSLEVLTLSLNEMIYNDTKSEKYLSIFLGLVDTRRNGLHYINAGHCPPILIHGETGEYQLLSEGGTVIGLFPVAEYTRGSVRLNPGDVLICCTDGIGEASNAEDEEYGSDRLAQCVSRNRHKPAQAIVEAVLAEVQAFAAGGRHIDDKVLMITKVTGDGKWASASSSQKMPAMPS